MVGSPTGSATRCCCQTFSKSVFGVVFMVVPFAPVWSLVNAVCADGGGRDLVRCAVGIDEDGVGDVLDDGGAGWRLSGPAGDAVHQRRGNVVGFDGVVGEEPHGVLGVGLVRGFAVFDPVDGGEDDEGMRAAEVDPEEAA